MVDLIADVGLKWVKGKVVFIPWLMFALSFVLASVGVMGIAVMTLLAPVALKLAYKSTISQLMMGIQAGSFFPLNIFGAIVTGGMQASGFDHSPELLLLNCFIYFSIVSFMAFFLLGGIRLIKCDSLSMAYVAASKELTSGAVQREKRVGEFTLYKGICLTSIPVLGIMTIGFGMNLGIAALIVGLVISLIAPSKQADILKAMPWGMTLLVTGIVTYVGVMEKIGVIKYVSSVIENMDNPALAAFTVTYIGGFVSAFASTTGILVSAIPMVEPILMNPGLYSLNVISMISVSTSVVDLSPFYAAGDTLLANVQGIKERVFFRQLLMTTAILIVLGPGLAWLLFVGIEMLW